MAKMQTFVFCVQQKLRSKIKPQLNKMLGQTLIFATKIHQIGALLHSSTVVYDTSGYRRQA